MYFFKPSTKSFYNASTSKAPQSIFAVLASYRLCCTNDEAIDWRILDMIGDKVIIIALNHSQTINGKTKQLVRIVEYKNIDNIY